MANITFYMEKDGISYQEATKKYHSELQKERHEPQYFVAYISMRMLKK